MKNQYTDNEEGNSAEVQTERKLKLKRHFGVFHGVAIVCGIVIGTGIWISPGIVMERTNSIGSGYMRYFYNT